MATFTYFAYGSNMLLERLQKRCETASHLWVAVAHGYTLAFSKKSDDGSGKATIERTANDDTVYGALYMIDLKDRAKLDRHEGFGYDRNDEFEVSVKRADDIEKLVVTTYVAKHSEIDNNLMPYHWYKKLILAGAWQRKLPDYFIAKLEKRESVRDPCPERTKRKEALAVLKETGWVDALGRPARTIKTDPSVRIAGENTVAHWEKLKEILIVGEPDNWKQAFEDFFKARIETRYFEPIRLLKEHGNKKGEGFAITALHCTLIEFLASTLKGKSYKHNQPRGYHEYGGSTKLFIDFLRKQIPFKDYFSSNTEADRFYKNVRCALLHEARTKDGWKIIAKSSSDLPIDVKKKIVYRNNLHLAFEEFVDWYGKCLPCCDKLQRAFIRKFDSLCIEKGSQFR